MLILHYFMENGPKRYNEIQKFLQTVSKKTLTNQLRELEDDGVIKREVYPTRLILVSYSITEHGRTLYPILEAMCEWGSRKPGINTKLQTASVQGRIPEGYQA